MLNRTCCNGRLGSWRSSIRADSTAARRSLGQSPGSNLGSWCKRRFTKRTHFRSAESFAYPAEVAPRVLGLHDSRAPAAFAKSASFRKNRLSGPRPSILRTCANHRKLELRGREHENHVEP